MQLDFLVMRKGLDPTAETSLHALRDLMGEDVVDVEHGTLWRIDLQPAVDVGEVKQAFARAACRAGRYVNLNRDDYCWLDEPQPGRPGERGGCSVDLWICDGDGQDDVARAYFETQLQQGLERLRRGTLYRLWLPLQDPEEARRKGRELAWTCSRSQGLLMNPHSQILEILQGSCGEEA
jgi:hypothetical protein